MKHLLRSPSSDQSASQALQTPAPCQTATISSSTSVTRAVIMTTPEFKLRQTRKSAEMTVIAIQPAKKPARK
ncbi:MAG: hypothetical protein NXI17_20850 [Alphaproteobacteria bacterium]|nr:hypothetical protein [Alphaproteobacteria bacterium]